jgi:putative NIF3 family GTP cyclohydrolase 1 type 2
MSGVSRRQFGQGAGAAVAVLGAGGGAQAQGRLTAGEVVRRVMANQGTPWIDTGFRDTFKIGGPEAVVTGIATTFGGNLSVLQAARAAGMNMVIVHEPTFWTDGDIIGRVQDDPLYRAKRAWAEANDVVVWRNHDNVHTMRPDLIYLGWAQAMGWQGYSTDPLRNSTYVIPATTLTDLARTVAARLKLRSVVLGRGVTLPEAADVRITSDVREWDAYEYARDAVYAGRRKGLIVISHVAHEDPGMAAFADFLRPLVPEVPVRYEPTPCVFWTV